MGFYYINRRIIFPHITVCLLTMLERAVLVLGTTRVTSKVALMAGSSQHGRARRASVDYKHTNKTQLISRGDEGVVTLLLHIPFLACSLVKGAVIA